MIRTGIVSRPSREMHVTEIRALPEILTRTGDLADYITRNDTLGYIHIWDD